MNGKDFIDPPMRARRREPRQRDRVSRVYAAREYPHHIRFIVQFHPRQPALLAKHLPGVEFHLSRKLFLKCPRF